MKPRPLTIQLSFVRRFGASVLRGRRTSDEMSLELGAGSGASIGERVALLDFNPAMKVDDDLRTPPIKVTAGPQTIVTVNRGRADGLEVGHVLALYNRGDMVSDVTKQRGTQDAQIQLPDERAGLAHGFNPVPVGMGAEAVIE